MVVVTVSVLGLALAPLYRPTPRRILDTIELVERRLLIGVFALATVGYFDLSFRVPRPTLIVATLVLGVALPVFFLGLKPSGRGTPRRAVVVGDDPNGIAAVVRDASLPVVGYVAPPGVGTPHDGVDLDVDAGTETGMTDGGVSIATPTGLHGTIGDTRRLGGLSQLDEVLVDHEVDTAVLAFARPDRAEFFGTLDTCYDRGITAMVHRRYADVVLTDGVGRTVGDLVEIDLDPWNWTNYVLKRAFDVAFAVSALVALSPVLVAVAVAIKLDSSGPIFYTQRRTAEFGGAFTVYKFRSMVTDAEAATGAKLSEEDKGGVDPRVTRVGRVLRRTHLDEVPQLWSILVGDMSVVGPRPERPELDADIETDSGVAEWRQRWFVRPGLTGLAQIHDVTGHEPAKKLQYDVAYIRQQSFWFDLKIVVRQLWMVVVDVFELLRS